MLLYFLLRFWPSFCCLYIVLRESALFFLADYDYRIMSVEDVESNQIASQSFVQRKCSLYPTAITELSYCGRTAKSEVKYCSCDDDLELSWFTPRRFLSSVAPGELCEAESYCVLDYRIARELRVGVGDTLLAGSIDSPVVVAAVCAPINFYTNPPALLVSKLEPAKLVPEELNAESMFLSVSDHEAAERYMSDVYPLLSKEADEADRYVIARQTVTTRGEELARASEGAFSLGLIVILYVLGCVFAPLYAGRFVSQLVARRKEDCLTLQVLGLSRRWLVFFVTVMAGVELASAALIACALSKVLVERLIAFEYPMAEQVFFSAPYVFLLALAAAVVSALLVPRLLCTTEGRKRA